MHHVAAMLGRVLSDQEERVFTRQGITLDLLRSFQNGTLFLNALSLLPARSDSIFTSDFSEGLAY